ncbi:hypothetical protein TNCV_3622291 [Trichonephila clavipes]|nr:hypothetical protein TNCV_3622291 [Trichonephila clavipes]
MSVQRFLKLEEALELFNNLDSDESDVEIAVLPPDANELTGKDEGDENEINTGEIIVNDVPGCLEVSTGGLLLLTGYKSNTCERDYWSDAEDLRHCPCEKCHVTKPLPKVEILFTRCGQWNFPCLNCGGGNRWCRHLSSLREFIRAKSYCHLHGAQAPCRKYGLHRNVGASRFNGPYGRQGCVLARTVESNQGGRFDGNESVADSFRSGVVSFKKHVHAISPGFFSLLRLPEKKTRLTANSLPGVTLSSTPFLSDKYHPCKF